MWIKLLNTVWITYTAQLTSYTWLPTFIVRLHVSNQHNSTKNMLPIFFGSLLWSSIKIVQWHYIRRRNICDEKRITVPKSAWYYIEIPYENVYTAYLFFFAKIRKIIFVLCIVYEYITLLNAINLIEKDSTHTIWFRIWNGK